MTIKVAINGYGRIGRNILRALYEAGRTNEIRIVAINDLGDAQTNAHLTRFDTAHGKFNADVKVDGDHMVVNGDRIRVCAADDCDSVYIDYSKNGSKRYCDTGNCGNRMNVNAYRRRKARETA